MKQSTLFSMVSNVNGHQKTVREATESNVTNKENVKAKTDETVSVEENGSVECNVDILELDTKTKGNTKQNLDPQSEIKSTKEVFSYEDFLNDNTNDKLTLNSKKDDLSDERNCMKAKTKTEAPIKGRNNNVDHYKSESNSHTHKEADTAVINGDSTKEKSKNQSVSYEDFLGMFKPAPVSHNVDDCDQKETAETDETKEDNDVSDSIIAKKDVVKCKSITSFFKPVSKDKKGISGKKKTEASSTFTVTAEVHIVPSSESESETPKVRKEKKKQQNKIVVEKPYDTTDKNDRDVDEIVFVNSIEVDDTPSEQGTRKRKFESESTKKESGSCLQLKKKKCKDNSSDIECSKSKDSKSSRSPSNSGQCKLSFGASGLTISKAQPNQEEENEPMDVVTDSPNNVKLATESDVKSKANNKTQKKLKLKSSTKSAENGKESKDVNEETVSVNPNTPTLDSNSNDNNTDCHQPSVPSDLPVTEAETENSALESCKHGRLRLRPSKTAETKKKIPNSSEEDLVEKKYDETKDILKLQSSNKEDLEEKKCDESEENLKSKNTTNEELENKKTSNESSNANAEEVDGPPTPSLRRSSRLKESAESSKKAEVIEVDSDEEEERVTKGARKGGKEKTKKLDKAFEQSSAKNDGSQSSKVQRKLAPIFTRLKPAQAEAVKAPPPPTPEELEKLRARREFLMSGIPDELKRAKAALDLQALPEYPSFPSPSHIQQIDELDLTSGDAVKMMRNLPIQEKGPCSFIVNVSNLKWDHLGWNKLAAADVDTCAKLPFQGFVSHPAMDRKTVDVLIKELECRDKSFPFKETFESFTAVKDITQAIDTTGASHQDDIIIVDDSTPQKSAVVSKKSNSNFTGILWTDEHPVSSKHFVGNSKAIHQLKDWLQQWQEELKKEARKAMKGGKARKDTKKKVQDWSDDSDFTNSSEEDSRLCNTMLVTGPHGVGKTSAVYCLAKEMGFKIFEVNPTSLRSGKQLQSQLEEATQSHRVASSSNPSPGMFGTPPAGTLKVKQAQELSKPVEKPPACKAFSSFFKAKSTTKKTEGKKSEGADVAKKESVETKPPKSDKKKGRKRKDEGDAKTEAEKGNTSGGDVSNNPLNLTSSSIILFDEADIVLEDDRGFLSTVQHFMSSTKIPIIITATDPSIHSELSPRHEHIVLKRPSVKSISSFLHTICLTRDLRMGHNPLVHLVTALNQDIRQCLLYIQFWCESGGGQSQIKSDLLVSNSSTCEVTKVANSGDLSSRGVASSDNSNDSDFLSLRPARKRQRRMRVVDDDDENSNSNSNSTFSHCGATSTLKSNLEEIDESVKDVDAQTAGVHEGGGGGVVALPQVHIGCDVSLLGGHDACDSIESTIVDLIRRSELTNPQGTVDKINHMESYLTCNFLYNAALHCCSLHKIDPLPIRLEIRAPKNKNPPKKKRKRIMVGDWMDSDGSSDDERKDDGKDDKSENNRIPSLYETDSIDKDEVKPCVEMKDSEQVLNCENVNNDELEKSIKDVFSSSPKDKTSSLTSNLLHVFSRFYETNSCVQSLYCGSGVFRCENDKQCLLPGVSDEEVLNHESEIDDDCNRLLCREICGNVELLSARTLVTNVDKCLKRGGRKEEVNLSQEEQTEERNSLPIGSDMTDVWAFERRISDISNDSSTKNIASCVGTWVQGSTMGSRSSLHLDYMPMLREMCRSEQERQTTNAKRRFNHYLDHNGLNLRDSTKTSLTTTYTITKD